MSEFTRYIQAINVMIKDDKFYRIALSSVLPGHKARIFNDGMAADGSKIGTYVDGPYAKKKAAAGRNPGYVNLRNTDYMMQDYRLITVKPSQHYGFGFLSSHNMDKVLWNEERYGKKVFETSKEDDQLLDRVLNVQIKGAHAQNGIFNVTE